MTSFVKRHPALALLIVSMTIGLVILVPVMTGVAPSAMIQLGAASASTAGFILAGVEGGRAAVAELARRVLIWRVGLGWWAFALLFPAIPTVVAITVGGAIAKHPADWSVVGPWYTFIPTLVFLILFAGLGEEFGWRGFAIPRLLTRHSALTTSLIIGVCHSIWHIPLFFLKGELYHNLVLQYGFFPAFLGYASLVLSLSVQIAWLFTNTRGSVLLAAVYHGAGNAWNGYLDIYRGQIIGIYVYLVLMAVVSITLAVWYGPGLLTRANRRTMLAQPAASA